MNADISIPYSSLPPSSSLIACIYCAVQMFGDKEESEDEEWVDAKSTRRRQQTKQKSKRVDELDVVDGIVTV